jgi:predicted HicB family RNase H-like nuclease
MNRFPFLDSWGLLEDFLTNATSPGSPQEASQKTREGNMYIRNIKHLLEKIWLYHAKQKIAMNQFQKYLLNG